MTKRISKNKTRHQPNHVHLCSKTCTWLDSNI